MSTLNDPRIENLLTRLDELVRWRPGADGEYQDPHSALARIKGATNHLVMGRRGSGKTRLLDELRKTSRGTDTLVISIESEDYKELTYPDILIQILRAFLREFSATLGFRPDAFTQEWIGGIKKAIRHPILSHKIRIYKAELLEEARGLHSELDSLLRESDEVDAEYVTTMADERRSSTTHGFGADVYGVACKVDDSASFSEARGAERRASQREMKRVKVERLLSDFKHLMKSVCEHLGARIILGVDDFYFIRREDQPPVIDYIHRICKDTNAFLKVATIKHRSKFFSKDGIARGVVEGHEIQPIDLELPLSNFDSVTKFMSAVWGKVCEEVKIKDSRVIFKGQGFEQAILASGGVPRDFFGVIKMAISIARERQEDAVGIFRINEAAKLYTEDTKFPEFRVDSIYDETVRDIVLWDIVRYVRDVKKKNCFHVDLDRLGELSGIRMLLDSLVDSRLLHLITDNTSNARKEGRYAAYLLDVGLYGHPQRRGDKAIDEIKFWEKDNAGRLKNLSRSPVYPLRSIGDIEDLAKKVKTEGISIQDVLFKEDKSEYQAADQGAGKRSAEKQLELLLPVIDEE